MALSEFNQCINKSTYFDTFNETDKRLRFCTNIDCKKDYMGSIRILSKTEYDYLFRISIQKINDLFAMHKIFVQIPWKIVICHDKESQFPHTHGDFIVLPDSIFEKHANHIMQTLIHEKVHVYQRLYPCQTNILFTKFWGFKIKTICNYSDMRRSNPDINKIVYIDDNGNKFDNDYVENATKLGEIKDKRDHPNEMMAYIIQDYFMQNAVHSKYVDGMQNWLKLGMF